MIKHIFYLIPLLWIVLLCCGCPSDASKQQKETLAELKEINAAIKALKALQSTFTEEIIISSSDYEKTLAAIKPLPPNPTDAQITAYIDSVIASMGGWTVCGGHDPRIEYLRKVGPGHIAVLLSYLEESEDSLAVGNLWKEALPDLVADNDKAKVIELLPRYPVLAKIVVDRGWANDAKTEFFKSAWRNDFGSYDLESGLRTFVTTPEDRQELTRLFLEKPEYDDFYPLVSSFAGANPKALALTVWEKHRYNSSINQFDRAVRAASFGNPEALESAVSLYFTARDYVGDDKMKMLLAQTTGQVLNKKILRKWYEENHDKLIFNAEKRRFEVK